MSGTAQAAASPRDTRSALIDALRRLRVEGDAIAADLDALNEPPVEGKAQAALAVIAAFLAVQLPQPNHAVADGLELIRRALGELYTSALTEDPADRGHADNVLLGGVGRLRMQLDAAAKAAERAYRRARPVPTRRGTFDAAAVKAFLAELDTFQAAVKAVEAEKNTAPRFVQQGELVTFYVGDMSFRIHLARLQLTVNNASLDLGAIVENIAAIRDDSARFRETVLTWFNDVTAKLLTETTNLAGGVAGLVAGVTMLGGMIEAGDDGPDMVLIQPGSFQMGIPAAESKREGTEPFDDDARPVHRVTIPRPFLLGRYPVTRGEYAEFVRDSGRPWEPPDFEQTDRHPAVNVSFDDAVAYAAWLSDRTGHRYRLPSEAEWEYACRAGTVTARYWGDSFDQAMGHFGGEATSEVGRYPANPWGLFDMLGNVAEWVADTWHDSYKGAPTDGSAWTTTGSNDGRVLRGGWFPVGNRDGRAGYRVGSNGRPSPRVGFRLARTL